MPAMEVTLREFVAAPPERVFAVAADFPNAAAHVEGITKVEILTTGPIGAGTRFRESRVMFGKEATETMTVAEFEPPKRYVLTADSMGTRYRSELRFEPKNGGTEMVMQFRGEPHTLAAKLMSILLRPMIKSVAKSCAKDLADIRRTIEATP